MTEVARNEALTFLNDMGPEELLRWAYENFGSRAGIFTSFQNTGCVMIDMARRVAPKLRIVTVDTLRLPQETYELMSELERRYGVRIDRYEPDPQRLAEMIRDNGEYLFFDSREKQELCCHVRKVEPNQRAMQTVDVWITGLRRDQSKRRMATQKVSFPVIQNRRIIKLCPLLDWSEQDVWTYIRDRQVPYNGLYDKGYASIGCAICSTPIRTGEDKRAGRWRWMNQLSADNHKECGIHVDGSGI